MVRGKSPAVLRDLRTLFDVGTSNGLTDAQLLEQFRARSDPNSSGAAFASLMARHGPMVLGVCRRALRNPDDVADAFQVTFLVLVRKADSVRVDDSLGRWLYGVSRRVAVRAKHAVARRSAREVRDIELAAAPAASAELDELHDVLDDEIGRLPEKFRSAVVLCELEGLSHDEAARQLGCAVGTVKSRLSRGREKLRARLIRRGVAPTAWALSVQPTPAALPAELIETTVKAAIGYADGILSPAVNLLIQGVLQTMLLNKLSTIAITLVASLALATSAGLLARQAASLPGDQRGSQRVPNKPAAPNESASTNQSTAPDHGESKEHDDESNDQVEALKLDVELLQSEVQALGQAISNIANELIQIQLYGTKSNGTMLGPDAKQSEIATLQKNRQDFRKDYLSKKKEMRHKQAELFEIEEKQRQENRRRQAEENARPGARINGRGGRGVKQVPVQPAASDAPAISPILEKRLSGIEEKLDQVLKALEDLKRESNRQ